MRQPGKNDHRHLRASLEVSASQSHAVLAPAHLTGNLRGHLPPDPYSNNFSDPFAQVISALASEASAIIELLKAAPAGSRPGVRC